jgi:hypothetical protein
MGPEGLRPIDAATPEMQEPDVFSDTTSRGYLINWLAGIMFERILGLCLGRNVSFAKNRQQNLT